MSIFKSPATTDSILGSFATLAQKLRDHADTQKALAENKIIEADALYEQADEKIRDSNRANSIADNIGAILGT